MGTGFGVNERGVAGSVRSLDFDVGFDHLEAPCLGRPGGSGKSGGHRECYKVAASDIPGLRVIFLLLLLVFGHGCLFQRMYHFFDWRDCPGVWDGMCRLM